MDAHHPAPPHDRALRAARPGKPGPRTRFKCRFCGQILPAWLRVARPPNGTMLLHHLSQQHPAEARAYLKRIHRTEDIGRMAAEAFEVIEERPRDEDHVI